MEKRGGGAKGRGSSGPGPDRPQSIFGPALLLAPAGLRSQPEATEPTRT